jgi:hypothetical protein
MQIRKNSCKLGKAIEFKFLNGYYLLRVDHHDQSNK